MMNIEAALIIGGAALLLAAVLLIPGLMWARRKARRNPEAPIARKVETGVFGIAAVAVFIILGALSAPSWGPDTAFGQWMSTDSGVFMFLGILAAAGLIARHWAHLRSNVLTQRK